MCVHVFTCKRIIMWAWDGGGGILCSKACVNFHHYFGKHSMPTMYRATTTNQCL